MKTIKISDDVWQALQKKAVPFEDTPDDVLRRILSPNADQAEPTSHEAVSSASIRSHANAKAEGAQNRREYVQQLRAIGIHLEHERRTAYTTPRGNRVVLPLANRPYQPGKWFLGAPKEFFGKPNTSLILVCKEHDKFLDFVFPAKDVQKLVPMLTEVRGELRFNVRRDAGIYFVYRPGVDKMDITRYLHGYNGLRDL